METEESGQWTKDVKLSIGFIRLVLSADWFYRLSKSLPFVFPCFATHPQNFQLFLSVCVLNTSHQSIAHGLQKLVQSQQKD